MEIIKPDEGTKLPLEFIAIRRIERKDIELIELKLNENQTIALHSLTCKVIFYVKSGLGYYLNDKGKNLLEKGSIVVVEPNEQRGWLCEKGQGIELLVFKMMM